MMASETSDSGVAESATFSVAVPVTAVPSGLYAMAVITVIPEVAADATPVAGLIVATAGVLDAQVAALIVEAPMVAFTLVRLTVAPDEVVPMAMYWVVSPAVASVCVAGTMDSDTSGSGVEMTVNVAVPVTTVPSGFFACAVIATVPVLWAVAIPVAGLIVAIALLLDPHTAALMVADPTVAV